MEFGLELIDLVCHLIFELLNTAGVHNHHDDAETDQAQQGNYHYHDEKRAAGAGRAVLCRSICVYTCFP